MSKVLIDRALLERAVYSLELAYETDTPTIRDICSALSAPSGTPAMPVKAYYHEAPNEYGGLNKSVGLEVRKQFADAPLVLESDALARIACLEGEIAKRDARIVELESQYQRDVWGLNNEGDPIGGEPAGGYANDNARLRAELAAIKAQEPVAYISGCYRDVIDGKSDRTPLGAELAFVNMGWIGQIPLYAAPVSEAKARGSMLQKIGKRLAELLDEDQFAEVEQMLASLNAAPVQQDQAFCKYCGGNDEEPQDHCMDCTRPVQQVSVPDGWRLVKVGIEGVQFGNAWFSHEGITGYTADQLNSGNCRITGRAYMDWLAAAPAAPAADAGLVEALDYQVLFDAIAAATSVYANGAVNISVQAFRDALAAHRAQGVV